MADKGKKAPAKKTEKTDCYFGCVPKEEVPKFIDNLKVALQSGTKTNDKKEGSLEVRGTKSDPKGVAFEVFSVNKSNYAKYCDNSKDYMKDALSVLTVSFGIKSKDAVKSVEALVEKFKPMILMQEPFKKHPDKYKFNLRSTDTRVYLDIVNTEGKILGPLLDLNMNMSEFHNFNCSLKSEFRPDEFFTLPVEQFALKSLQLVLSCKGESKNLKYLIGAVTAALKQVKLTKKANQQKLEKVLSYLTFINAFVSSKLKFEFNAEEVCKTGLEVSKAHAGGQDLNTAFGGMRTFVEGLGAQVKPQLEAQGLLEFCKSIDVDQVTVCGAVPKYENGAAVVISLPGFSKAFQDKFLA